MIIEEIPYKTSGKLKAAQKRAQNEAKKKGGGLSVRGEGIKGTGIGGGGKTADRRRSFSASIDYAAQEAQRFDSLEPHQKAELVLVQNLDMPDPDLAAIQMEAIASNNLAVKNPCHHIVMSWAAGELPTPAQQKDCVNHYLKEAGYGEHQAIAYLHRDRDKYHIHIIANQVHPVTFKSVHRDYMAGKEDYKRHERVARELELKYGWQRVEGKHCAIVDDKVVEVKHGKKIKISDTALKVERSSGIQSFESWCYKSKESIKLRAEIKELTVGNVTWDAIHAKLAEHNLEIKPDKNRKGLVVVDKGNPDVCHVKASALSRDLSGGNLAKKIKEPYQPPAADVAVKTKSGYQEFISEEQTKNLIYSKYTTRKSEYETQVESLKNRHTGIAAQLKQIDAATAKQVRKVQGKHRGQIALVAGRMVLTPPTLTREQREQIEAIRQDSDRRKAEIRAEYVRERSALDERYPERGSYRTYLQAADTPAAQAELQRMDSTRPGVKDQSAVIPRPAIQTEQPAPTPAPTAEETLQERYERLRAGVAVTDALRPSTTRTEATHAPVIERPASPIIGMPPAPAKTERPAPTAVDRPATITGKPRELARQYADYCAQVDTTTDPTRAATLTRAAGALRGSSRTVAPHPSAPEAEIKAMISQIQRTRGGQSR